MIPEREKVMRGIECCMRENNTNMCGDCPYHDSSETRFGCMRSAMRDALELLEVKNVEIKTNAYKWKFYHCPTCGKDFYGFDKRVRFCNQCGQGIRWPEKEDGDG